MLTSDLDGTDTRDRASLDAVLSALVTQLNMSSFDLSTVSERTSCKEVQLVVMRLLSKNYFLQLLHAYLYFTFTLFLQYSYQNFVILTGLSCFQNAGELTLWMV